MTRPGPRHARRSQWAVFDRCLALLIYLMAQPATSHELLQIVFEKAEADGEHLKRSAATRRFEEDRQRLRTWMGADIRYDRSENLYMLYGIDRALIDLSPEALRGLAFLQSTFSSNDAPMSLEVRTLIERVQMALPSKSRREIGRQRGLLELNLRNRDEDQIPEVVWDAVQTACSEQRQLEFDYHAPGQSDGKPRTHVVEPSGYAFDPVRGHYYLECFWIESRGPLGTRLQRKMQAFRLGRILNPHILPTHFPSGGRSVLKEELVYELTPEIARRGVTRHFPGSLIVQQPDGGAMVRTFSSNLFLDLRTLLHYGPNCRVVGGEKAVEEMKLLIKQMYQVYQS